MTTIYGEKIKTHIPHRYENLLIDSCTQIDPSPDGVIGTHNLTINKDDAQGRQIFLRQKRPGQYVLLNVVVAEILALASIINSGGMEDGYIAFFSAITKFEIQGDIAAETLWSGEIKKVSEKAGFHRYYGNLSDGTAKGSCEVMAFYMDPESLSAEPEESKTYDLPAFNRDEPIAPFPHKDPAMTAVTTLNAIDSDGYNCVCSYTYPEDHPFIKGHFPDEPVMMGVMQWMMVEDAITVWSKETNQSGKHTLNVDASIYLPDGQIVCEVKQAQCLLYAGVDDIYDQTELVATKKVAFRNRVTPGKELLVCIKINDQTKA